MIRYLKTIIGAIKLFNGKYDDLITGEKRRSWKTSWNISRLNNEPNIKE